MSRSVTELVHLYGRFKYVLEAFSAVGASILILCRELAPLELFLYVHHNDDDRKLNCKL